MFSVHIGGAKNAPEEEYSPPPTVPSVQYSWSMERDYEPHDRIQFSLHIADVGCGTAAGGNT